MHHFVLWSALASLSFDRKRIDSNWVEFDDSINIDEDAIWPETEVVGIEFLMVGEVLLRK